MDAVPRALLLMVDDDMPSTFVCCGIFLAVQSILIQRPPKCYHSINNKYWSNAYVISNQSDYYSSNRSQRNIMCQCLEVELFPPVCAYK